MTLGYLEIELDNEISTCAHTRMLIYAPHTYKPFSEHLIIRCLEIQNEYCVSK